MLLLNCITLDDLKHGFLRYHYIYPFKLKRFSDDLETTKEQFPYSSTFFWFYWVVDKSGRFWKHLLPLILIIPLMLAFLIFHILQFFILSYIYSVHQLMIIAWITNTHLETWTFSESLCISNDWDWCWSQDFMLVDYRSWMETRITGNVMFIVLVFACGRYIAVTCHILTSVSRKWLQLWFVRYIIWSLSLWMFNYNCTIYLEYRL